MKEGLKTLGAKTYGNTFYGVGGKLAYILTDEGAVISKSAAINVFGKVSS